MSAKRLKTKSDNLLIDEFNWDEYLEDTNSEAAKAECFFQSDEIPENLFQEDTKVETIDPRSGSSMCIATVVGKLGPRIRLRLDGTDSCNDFWVLVDSSSIHPIGYTHSRGGVLQPPLGFQQDISNWNQYLTKTLGSCNPADNECFQLEPKYRPKTNLFKVGTKLEAVDRKNPFLICPSTVVAVSREEITIGFDGWSSAFNTKFRYDSRDLFPVGWCQKAGFPLQTPPKTKKHVPKLSVESGSSSQREREVSSSPSDRLFIDVDMPVLSPAQLGSKGSGDSATGAAVATDSSSFQPEDFFNRDDSPIDGVKLSQRNGHGSKTGVSPKIDDKKVESILKGAKPFAMKSLPPSDLSPLAKQKLTAALNPVVTIPSTEQLKETTGADKSDSARVKLKVKSVKGSPTVTSVTVKPKSLKPDVVIGGSSSATVKVTLYLHSQCHFGPHLDAEKLESLPKQLGPGSINRVFQEATQSLVNAAKRVYSTLQLIPSGPGPFSISADTGNMGTHVRSLPFLTDENHFNAQLSSVLKKLDCCGNLLSKELICTVCSKGTTGGSSSKKKGNKVKDATYSVDLSRKRHHSGESSASGPSSTASAVGYVNGHKTDDPSEWTSEHVSNWIGSQKDSTISSLAELFLKHEIDGKALVLLEGEMMIKYMGIRLGPALKVQSLIDRLLGVNRRVQH